MNFLSFTAKRMDDPTFVKTYVPILTYDIGDYRSAFPWRTSYDSGQKMLAMLKNRFSFPDPHFHWYIDMSDETISLITVEIIDEVDQATCRVVQALVPHPDGWSEFQKGTWYSSDEIATWTDGELLKAGYDRHYFPDKPKDTIFGKILCLLKYRFLCKKS